MVIILFSYFAPAHRITAITFQNSFFCSIYRYGIETFSQLVVGGSLVNSTINIDDEPKYVHRGLMLDTG